MVQSVTTDKIDALLNELPLHKVAEDELLQQLGILVNNLIEHDFHALVQLLYRVDVSEQKLKQLLQQLPNEDAVLLIAGLLLQRQREKALMRNATTANKDDIPDEERW